MVIPQLYKEGVTSRHDFGCKPEEILLYYITQIYSGITFVPQPRFRVLMLYAIITFIKSVMKSMQDYEIFKRFLCPNGSCFSSVLVSCLGRFCWLCMFLTGSHVAFSGF